MKAIDSSDTLFYPRNLRSQLSFLERCGLQIVSSWSSNLPKRRSPTTVGAYAFEGTYDTSTQNDFSGNRSINQSSRRKPIDNRNPLVLFESLKLDRAYIESSVQPSDRYNGENHQSRNIDEAFQDDFHAIDHRIRLTRFQPHDRIDDSNSGRENRSTRTFRHWKR